MDRRSLLLLIFLAHLANRAATNDFFAQRAILTGSNAAISTSFDGASREPGEPHDFPASLWWEWTAPLSGGVAVESFGFSPNVTSAVMVFRGTALTNLVLLSKPAPSSKVSTPFQSLYGIPHVSFRAEAGTTYFIALGAQSSSPGAITLRLTPGPANDDFDQAIPINGENFVSTVNLQGATKEFGEPHSETNGSGASVWWSWKPGASKMYSVWVRSQATPPSLNLYRGTALTNLALVGAAQGGNRTLWAHLTTQVDDPNESFWIRVADAFSDLGSVSLTLFPLSPAPSSDEFRNATLQTKLSFSGTTVGATFEPGEQTLDFLFNQSVWYRWIAPASSGYELTVSGSAQGNRVQVLKGTNLTGLLVVQSLYDGQDGEASGSFPALAGEQFYFRVDGETPGGDLFDITLTPSAPNDSFATRSVISSIKELITSTTIGASRETNEPSHNFYYSPRTLWWEWVAPGTGGFFLTSSNDPPPDFAIYQGSTLEGLTPIQSNESRTPNVRRTFRSNAGEKYLIALSTGGPGQSVSFSINRGPINDEFASAVVLSGLDATLSGTTLGATTQNDEPRLLSPGRTVWYRWNPQTNGAYTVFVEHAYVGAFIGTEGSSLTPVGTSSSGFWNGATAVVFHALTNQTIYFAVDSFDPAQFTIQLSSAPPNDNFSNANIISGTDFFYELSPFVATPEFGEPILETNAPAPYNTLWWRWTAPETGGYRLSVTNGFGSSSFALFTGSALTNLNPIASRLSYGDFTLDFYAIGGTEYAIVFGSEKVAAGPTLLRLQATSSNDLSSRPTRLFLDVPVTNQVLGATLEPGEPSWFSAGKGTVWYAWTAPGTGSYILSAAVSFPFEFGLELAIFKGSDLSTLVPVVAATNWLANFGTLSLFAAAGETFSFVVALPDTPDERTLQVSVTSTDVPHDDLRNAAPLSGTFVLWKDSTVGATLDPGEFLPPGFLGTATVWARWLAPESGIYRIAPGVSPGQRTSVFEESNLSTEISSLISSNFYEFKAAAGHTYFLRVASLANAVSEFDLRLGPAFSNYDPPTASQLLGTNIFVAAQNWTSRSSSPPCESLWWKWTAPQDGMLDIDALNGTNLVRVSLYHGNRPTLNTNVITLPPPIWWYPFTTGNPSNRVVVCGQTDYYLSVATAPSTNIDLTVRFTPTDPLPQNWRSSLPGLLRGGETNWFVQNDTLHSAPDALEVRGLTSGGSAWIEAIYSGPGDLQFWWKLDAPDADVMNFYLKDSASGGFGAPVSVRATQDWTHQVVRLSQATNVVRWWFYPTARVTNSARAFLDDIEFIAKAPIPPEYTPSIGLDGLNTSFQLFFPTERGRIYTLQFSTNLAEWVDWTNFYSGSTSFKVLRFPFSTEPAVQFFRGFAK